MRSIKARFNKFNKEPNSTYLAFTKAVKYRKFSRDKISRNFIKLVDKSDYIHEDKNTLIDYLHYLSNRSEEHEIQPKQANTED